MRRPHAPTRRRPYVQLEVKEAMRLHKPVILLHETDERHGKFDFDCTTDVPIEFQPIARQLVENIESIGWERRGQSQCVGRSCCLRRCTPARSSVSV